MRVRPAFVAAFVLAGTAACTSILGLSDVPIPVDGGDESGFPSSDATDAGAGSSGREAGIAEPSDSTIAPLPEGSSSDSPGAPNSSEAASPPRQCEGGPGTCLSFTPSGSVSAADLVGDGLATFALAIGDAGGLTDGEAPGDTVLDVDNGRMTRGGIVIRPPTANPTMRDVQAGIAYRQTSDNLAIVTFGSLMIPANTTLKLVGIHAVALLSSTTIHIDGAVDIRPMSADGTQLCPDGVNAPGGFIGGTGELSGEGGSFTASMPGLGPGGGGAGESTGAGGGGHATAGGSGCSAYDAGTCGTAGGVYDLSTLGTGDFHGGSGGGGGGRYGSNQLGGTGGSGGGAVRFVAANSIEISGGIDASGCGGGTMHAAVAAGGGGGSGGAIVIEAPSVQLDATAIVIALGGAGGTGLDPNTDSPSRAGGTGLGNNYGCAGPTPAASHAGAGAGSPAGPGSDSGAQTGSAPNCSGGGGFGWIRINASDANPGIGGGAIVRPGLTDGALTIGALAP
jgi:hypothetical protein